MNVVTLPDKRTVTLHPDVTVVTGGNGCGKTAFLDAAILHLRKERTDDAVFRAASKRDDYAPSATEHAWLRKILAPHDPPASGAGARRLVELFVATADAARHVLRRPQDGVVRGTLFADDVEKDLDPTWQQRVVPALRKAFPTLRLVLTTRSAVVLSTVRAEHVRVLFPGRDAEPPSLQTVAVEPDTLLASIFGLDPRPDLPEARAASALRSLIGQGLHGSPEAAALQADLVSVYGSRHPVVLDVERLARFQAFKLKAAP